MYFYTPLYALYALLLIVFLLNIFRTIIIWCIHLIG